MGLNPIRLTALCAAVAAVPLLTGCSAGGSNKASGPRTPDGPPAVLVAGVEQLAAKSGCRLQSKTKAEEVTQGACKSAKDRYTLLTFTSDQGQQSWLTEAKNWGGTYLVGARWVAVGDQQPLETLRRQIGGEIQAGRRH